MPRPVSTRPVVLAVCAVLASVALAIVRAPAATAATNPRAQLVLLSGQTLASGQSITSPDGHYTLTMQSDGNLVLELSNPYGSPRVIWSSGTGSAPGASAQLQSNGNLVIHDAAGATIWSANISSPGCDNLDLQDDGNLVLYNATGAYWATNTLQRTLQPGDELLGGQTLLAPGADYMLQMGTDGYLRLIDSAGTVWTSPRGGPAGSYAVLLGNGDLQIRSTGGALEWDTATSASADAGAVGELTSTGVAELVAPGGTVTWSSGTAVTRTGLGSLNIARSFTACPPPPPPPPTPIHVRAPTSGSVTLRLPGVRVSIEVRWRFHGAASWMTAASVRRFPRDARLTVACRGAHGCPIRTTRRHGHRIRRRERFTARGRHVRGMLRHLLRRRFRVGARVIFTVTQPGHRAARSEAIIRRGRPPRSRVLR